VTAETEQGPVEAAYEGYAPAPKRPPFGSYAVMSTIFNASFAGALVAASRSGRLPERVEPGDVVLVGVATHKMARLITKQKITSFLRAPFTELEAKGGPGEVEERARGRGLRRVVGELLVCPYCLDLWTSAGLHVGVIFAPRVTRTVASTFTALTIADFLHVAYKALEQKGLDSGG
jgi:Protein of unknown function (DUF1360)